MVLLIEVSLKVGFDWTICNKLVHNLGNRIRGLEIPTKSELSLILREPFSGQGLSLEGREFLFLEEGGCGQKDFLFGWPKEGQKGVLETFP